jgi:hypothetical protein
MDHSVPHIRVDINLEELFVLDESVAEGIREVINDEVKKMVRKMIQTDEDFKERLKDHIFNYSRKYITVVEGVGTAR